MVNQSISTPTDDNDFKEESELRTDILEAFIEFKEEISQIKRKVLETENYLDAEAVKSKSVETSEDSKQ